MTQDRIDRGNQVATAIAVVTALKNKAGHDEEMLESFEEVLSELRKEEYALTLEFFDDVEALIEPIIEQYENRVEQIRAKVKAGEYCTREEMNLLTLSIDEENE